MTGQSEQRTVFLRFVLVNVLNTGLYWVLYLAFLAWMPYFWANALGLVIAVLVAYVANARFAFGVTTSRETLIKYLVANGTTILLRMAVVWVLVTPLSLPEQLAPPAAVAITTPIAYLLTRWAMTARVAGRRAAEAATPQQLSVRSAA